MKTITSSVLLFVLISCVNTDSEHLNSLKKEPETGKEGKLKSESFDSFYVRFHKDSMFQMSRVLFPLPGFKSEKTYESPDTDSSLIVNNETVNHYWTKEEWEMHKPIVDSTGLTIERNKNDSLYYERVFIPESDFLIIRKFSLIKDRWYLTYYRE